MHGYLLKQLRNNKVRNCTSSPISNRQSNTNSSIRKVQGCYSSVISNKHSAAVTSVSKVGDSTNSPTTNRQSVTGTSVCKARDCTSSPIANQYSAKDTGNSNIITDSATSVDNSNTKQCGGNSDDAQVYIVRTEVKSKYSNTEIIQTLQNPDENKLSHVMPVKPKGGEVFALDWQGDLKDYIADQYVWVADCTKTTTHSGEQLVKRCLKICDDSGIEHSKKLLHSKQFRKTASYLKYYPFLQLIEYIGYDNVYKSRLHGNRQHKTNSEYCRTAPPGMKEISKSWNQVLQFQTLTSLVQKHNTSNVQGVLNPRNREQVRNVQKQILRNQ